MLANSLGTTLELWDEQIPALTPHFRVLRYDMRGHGGSSIAGERFDVERLGRDVVGLLDALQLPRVHFCGLSLGGVVGMWLGANASNRLGKLALCNTAATLGARSIWDARIQAVQVGGMAAIASSVLERWFTSGFREREQALVARVRQMLLSIRPEGYVLACEAVRDADQRQNVLAVQAPCLVVAGTHDRATPPKDGAWLAEQIAGACYVELEAAHLSNVESPAAFNQALLEFLVA
jgi:3-oxoadipate enol-lactonase